MSQSLHPTNSMPDFDSKVRESSTVERIRKELRNEDPLTGEPGAHLIGTGVGAAVVGAAAGAAAGAAFGPVGAMVGTVVGSVVGGYAGKEVAEAVAPTQELEYWRGAYRSRPYYRDHYDFEDYEPAYRLGMEEWDGTTWDEVEPQMKRKWEDLSRWESEGGSPTMSWDEAREAAREAMERSNAKRNIAMP
jgi:hypothetical protein